MVGLNHEFARELLWREDPTDQRGCVFQQFRDVRGQVAPADADPDAFRERLRDIPKIHTWPRRSALNAHDNREDPARQGGNVVLLIHGELLKKYPNAVIYAHRAAWTRNAAGQPDITRERRLVEIPEAVLDDPPEDMLRIPLFEAELDPDIHFCGFDPSRDGALQTVNDTVWTDLIPSGSARQFIDPAIAIPALAPLGAADQEKARQREDDVKVLAGTVSASAWNAAPVADPLPERFVLVLDRVGARREVLGETVRAPLHVGLHPTGLLGALQPGFETEHQDYIAWLAQAAERSVEVLRSHRGLPGGRVPHALLYILALHPAAPCAAAGLCRCGRRDTAAQPRLYR